ncbi:MAG TPA: hypothetical protein VFX59_28970 [Polyangiales bacterium]|nr:hypothetical protein [Polyangiales bacterium]
MKKPELEHDAKSAEKNKGRDERNLGQRYGREDDSGSNHPDARERGVKGASNVGEDSTSGDG